MSGKAKLVWFVIVAFVVMVAELIVWPQTVTKTGSMVEFSEIHADQRLVVSAPASLEATASDFFLFRMDSGEVIYGIPADKPLGWSGDNYFTAKSDDMAKGKWRVQVGEGISIRLTGKDNVILTVDKIPSDLIKLAFAVLLPLVGIFVWSIIVYWR